MAKLPRLFPAAWALFLFAACGGSTKTAQLPVLQLPESLLHGAVVEGPAAAQAFAAWREQLPADALLPLSIHYSIASSAKFPRSPLGKDAVARAEFDYQGIDADRARVDATLHLELPSTSTPWDLTGSCLFDGFFLRAWGTAKGVPEVDPERIYAVRFQQAVFEKTYSSLGKLMPRFLQALDQRGIAANHLLDSLPEHEATQFFHPSRFLALLSQACECRSIFFAKQHIHCTLGLNIGQNSPLGPIFTTLLEADNETLQSWASTTSLDAVFDAQSGILLQVDFHAHFQDPKRTPNLSAADLEFQLQASALTWKTPKLAPALAHPETAETLDLTGMLQLADRFLHEQSAEHEAEKDYDF